MATSTFYAAAEDLGYTREAVDRLYAQYAQARDNGQSHKSIHAEGWCGEMVDEFSDRYYDEQSAYEAAMGDSAPTITRDAMVPL